MNDRWLVSEIKSAAGRSERQSTQSQNGRPSKYANGLTINIWFAISRHVCRGLYSLKLSDTKDINGRNGRFRDSIFVCSMESVKRINKITQYIDYMNT